jgi:DNA-binding transcriptional regulator LsrR (DeoR family)
LHHSFKKRDEIDIIFTSLASADDEHGLFRQYFEYLRDENLVPSVFESLQNQGWVGDILFQPFSETGALTPKPYRAVALFTFDELAAFSRRPGKHVVVIGGPCGKCGAPKTNALRPLLANPDARLWTRLIIDRDTALGLLDAAPGDDD